MDSTPPNPTTAIAVDFPAYVEQRRQGLAQHMVDGVPDYSFSLDNRLRRELASLAPVRHLARFLVRAREPFFQQLNMMDTIAVGPNQLPEIYKLARHCSRVLGIGVPQIFVSPEIGFNAYTFACDDVRPSIVLTSGLVRIMDEQELLAVIGHESGHIHNLHSAYNTLVELMSRGGLGALLTGGSLLGLPIQLVQGIAGLGLSLFMQRWSRCAEITSDRAGAICAGSSAAMVRALVKLQTHDGTLLNGVDIDAYVSQLEVVKQSMTRVIELDRTHPLTQKRIEALRLFHYSEGWLAWHPDKRTDGPVRSRQEVDSACEALVQVLGKGRSYTEGEQDYGIRG